MASPIASTLLDELFPSVGFAVVYTNEAVLTTITTTTADGHTTLATRPLDGGGGIHEDEKSSYKAQLHDVAHGSSQTRKAAMRLILKQATATQDGMDAFFQCILAMLMAPSIDEQERHWLVRVIGRVNDLLGSRVRPYVQKLLVAVQPMLIDKDHYGRLEASEIIASLSKSAGLATMITKLRPNIDNGDSYVRDTTARALSVVANTLGVPVLLPFIRAVCMSKRSWQAQHTGILIVRHISVALGCGVLPHLKALVGCVEHGLLNKEESIRAVAALALGSLAQAAHPYGYDAFSGCLTTLWAGIKLYRGKGLVAFLKALGFIIPLMDEDLGRENATQILPIILPHFNSHDDAMKMAVLQILRKCLETNGVAVAFVRTDIFPPFLKYFWNRTTALDLRMTKEVIEATVCVSKTIGTEDILAGLIPLMKDENEPLRLMVMLAIKDTIVRSEYASVDESIEAQLVDGALYAFQEQKLRVGKRYDGILMLGAIEIVLATLGERAGPYLPQLNRMVSWRLRSEDNLTRMQAADLIAVVAPVIGKCEDKEMLKQLARILYEYHGEEYPEVLGSILKAMNAVIIEMDIQEFDPPIGEVVQTLTPIFRNRHEKVQENCISVVGCIAGRDATCVPPREWMRVCVELTELLKAPKKSIRRAAVKAFGQIAQAIGPQDVLYTLLRNLKADDRQNRVSTTVAIAIVAESCGPYTVLPALMNEYRIPENNIQNGILKTLSFLFEYIGEIGKDYFDATLSLVVDALRHKDTVHRQIGSNATKHMVLGVEGMGCEDMLMHLLNHIWPNIYEQSPHVIGAVREGISGLRTSLGAGRLFQYTVTGLFHPAKRVRQANWQICNELHKYSADQLIMYYPSYSPQASGRMDEEESGKRRKLGERSYERDVECVFI